MITSIVTHFSRLPWSEDFSALISRDLSPLRIDVVLPSVDTSWFVGAIDVPPSPKQEIVAEGSIVAVLVAVFRTPGNRKDFSRVGQQTV